jgi:hypothetical protein
MSLFRVRAREVSIFLRSLAWMDAIHVEISDPEPGSARCSMDGTADGPWSSHRLCFLALWTTHVSRTSTVVTTVDRLNNNDDKMFKDMINKQVLELKKLWGNKRQLLFQGLNLAMIVFSALMIWKGLMFLTKVCNVRIVCCFVGVSYSNSMYVLFYLLIDRANPPWWSSFPDPWNPPFNEVIFCFWTIPSKK